MTTSTSIKERAARIELILMNCGEDAAEDVLADMLTDAMHWCDCTGRDFHIALATGCREYLRELNEEA